MRQNLTSNLSEEPLRHGSQTRAVFFPLKMCFSITKCSVLQSEGRVLIDIGGFGFACLARIVGAKKWGSAVCVAAGRMKVNCWGEVLLPRRGRFFLLFLNFFSVWWQRQHYNVCLVCHCVTPPALALIIDRCGIAGALISASVTNWLA